MQHTHRIQIFRAFTEAKAGIFSTKKKKKKEGIVERGMVQQHELIVWAMSATLVLAATSDSLNSAYHPNESTQRFLREVTFASREDQC